MTWLTIQPENVPAYVTRIPQWVLWRAETRNGTDTKVPYQVADRRKRADVSDPTTWGTFADAIDVCSLGGVHGPGFVLTDEIPLVGVDLDHAIDDHGKVAAWAETIVNRLWSYTEISPSGHGLRIFAHGYLPPNGRKKGNLEAYDTGRFLSVTGHRLPGTPTAVNSRLDELLTWHEEVWPPSTREACFSQTNGAPPPDLSLNTSPDLEDDQALLSRMFSATNGERVRALYEGKWEGLFASQSEADLSFCQTLAFWTGKDASRIDRLFRSSGLMRSKWNTRRGAMTYGKQTITKACASTTATYEGRPMMADPRPPHETGPTAGPVNPTLTKAGLDLSLVWPNGGPRFDLTAIRETREGVKGELTISYDSRRVSWGAIALASTSAREALRRKLEGLAPEVPWTSHLDHMAFEFTRTTREGEGFVVLTGERAAPDAGVLIPRMLYNGNPTLLFADGDSGKSLVALTLCCAVQTGTSLPCSLTPTRIVPCAYLDWETSEETVNGRLASIAAGLGVDPPPILYRRMKRPLVDEATALAAEFSRREIGFVVIDSKMFAVGSGEGVGFHEPIVAFYGALRLFAPAACLVINHVTGDAAKSGGPARPFGGAFAFNSPRLVYEAKRDQDIEDATCIAFTCKKANNLPRKPSPFGLRFVEHEESIACTSWDLTEAAPETMAAASLVQRLIIRLRQGTATAEELAEQVKSTAHSVRTMLARKKSLFAPVPGEKRPQRWALVSDR